MTTQTPSGYSLSSETLPERCRTTFPPRAIRRRRGFTLLEILTVLAIVAILAGLAATGFTRSRPRADLATTATELHALVRNARQTALLSGRATVVVVFPAYENRLGGTGRVVVVEDPAGTLFQEAATPNLAELDPATEGIDALDLPRSLAFGPEVGLGSDATLPPPFDRVAVNVACGFCGADRGAIRFDTQGHATFHAANGASLDVWGASLSLTAPDLEGAIRTLLVTSTTGSVRTLAGG